MANIKLTCPIRGQLNSFQKSKDGLTLTEESYRIEAIRYLISQGYPKECFFIEPVVKVFGNSGRNSMRSDFAVLDIPTSSLKSSADAINHAILLCEVKRDHAKSDYVKQTQVAPMLDFAPLTNVIGLYWDNIERRIFWKELAKKKWVLKDGPLSSLPKYGGTISAKELTYATLQPTSSLIDVFSRIEDILHQASFGPEKRYEIIFQLLLAKIFDEHEFEQHPNEVLGIQDYESLGYNAKIAEGKINAVLKRAISFYNNYLPKRVPEKLPIDSTTLLSVLKVLAPILITRSKREVVQVFYMKFAKDLYKWEMAQYFTPTVVTDFIMQILAPRFGDVVVDPACGSADFLIAAFRILRDYNSGHADSIYGYDNSDNAVQVAVLNMILNGDGKTNMKKQNSLRDLKSKYGVYTIVACNPPFGSKILEENPEILSNFDLGSNYEIDTKGKLKKISALTSQETGILFSELCVKLCSKNNGRIALIVPNGYLGNRSSKFKIVRHWILTHTRVAAIVSLPRFTFKSSGADVSASVLFLEKREKALSSINSMDDYPIAIESIEKIGWDAGTKKAKPIYLVDPKTGDIITDGENNPIIDSDFDSVLKSLANSDAHDQFEWLAATHREKNPTKKGWTIMSHDILKDPDLTMDAKRYNRKYLSLRSSIKESNAYIKLGDIVDFIPQNKTSSGDQIKKKKDELYQYVELMNIGKGTYRTEQLYGWELPDRAKHFSEAGDIYLGGIWGSVSKWLLIPTTAHNVVVTNGCIRCRIKPGKENYLSDLLSYLNSEGWAVQMRGIARGSDGLAEVWEGDAANVFIPLLNDDEREKVSVYVNQLLTGAVSLNDFIHNSIRNHEMYKNDPPLRPSHIVLV